VSRTRSAIASLSGVSFVLLLTSACTRAPEPPPPPSDEGRPVLGFEDSIVDAEGAGRLAIGDIDGDGQNDLVLHTWSTDRGKDSDGSPGVDALDHQG
jgi:hypothetical protein